MWSELADAFIVCTRCHFRSPGDVQMTLVEQLRSRKKALTVEELAGLLCIGIRTLYKEVEDNRIPFFRVRSSIRFDPHQIAQWLETKMPAHSVRTDQQNGSIAQAKIV
jgi:excisionase family DNA binding protein